MVEEGPRYKFGTVDAESELRDFNAEFVKSVVKIKPGNWFNAKLVEDTVTGLNELAGAKGYAFADVSPNFQRDAEKREMSITFRVGGNASRLCRADQHSGQHRHPRQGHPPRVPP